MTDEFDYVIVGSGAAGASAARILADSGRSIAIVEEGLEASTEQFEDRALTTFARLYRGGGAQVTSGRAPMLIIQGCCVGGSTVVNSAIMRRLPEDVWHEWEHKHHLGQALSFAEIESASDRIESELRVAATPEPIWGGNNRALGAGASSAGIVAQPTRRNAPGCRGSARCNLGCPHGAKQSMQLSYLPRALSRGAKLFAGQRAVAVVWTGSRVVGVRTERTFIAASRAVLLAASAVQTPDLLWRSGVRTPHVGRHFQGHPGMAVVGLFRPPDRPGRRRDPGHGGGRLQGDDAIQARDACSSA
jgi:choline dehydrogenase-like flavoprotein